MADIGKSFWGQEAAGVTLDKLFVQPRLPPLASEAAGAASSSSNFGFDVAGVFSQQEAKLPAEPG
eukprot:11156405-Lingulodinium_polyedra.AAC.1